MAKGSNKSWFGAVFGLIFVFAGLAAAHMSAGKMIFGYLNSYDWVEVSAVIHDLELVRNHGETTTYSVQASYSYQYNGNRYTSDRVSLSTGSDNIGNYWQDLHRSLGTSRSRDSATALVNPGNPAQAVLDRTFRWQALIFAFIFVSMFSGIGGFFTWVSLRTAPPVEERLQQEKVSGITSDQKHGSWLLGGFGALFFIMGSGMSALALPKALREGDYAALFILVFVIVGAGIMAYAFKSHRSYHKHGATPLFLNPQQPGIGGQLGGTFEIKAPARISADDISDSFQADLQCISKRRSGKNTYRSTVWHEETTVYMKQTSSGYRAHFVFDIPASCQASAEMSNSTSIDWQVVVSGNFTDGSDKFERSWQVDVVEEIAQAESAIVIPVSFMESAEKARTKRAKSSALKQIKVHEDDEYINIDSHAGRHIGSTLLGIVFGMIFGGVGAFAVSDGWWPGYIFVFIGGIVTLASVFSLGKAVEVKIDKDSRILYSRESWMGLAYAHKQGDVLDASQFKSKKTSSTQTGTKVTEYYVVNFDTGSTRIRIADGVEGKKEAHALVDEIVTCVFRNEQLSKAA